MVLLVKTNFFQALWNRVNGTRNYASLALSHFFCETSLSALDDRKLHLFELPAFADLMGFNGHLWLRISANVYSCKGDYIRLRDILVGQF